MGFTDSKLINMIKFMFSKHMETTPETVLNFAFMCDRMHARMYGRVICSRNYSISCDQLQNADIKYDCSVVLGYVSDSDEPDMDEFSDTDIKCMNECLRILEHDATLVQKIVDYKVQRTIKPVYIGPVSLIFDTLPQELEYSSVVPERLGLNCMEYLGIE